MPFDKEGYLARGPYVWELSGRESLWEGYLKSFQFPPGIKAAHNIGL